MSLASSYAKASDGTRLAYQIQGTGPGLVLLAGQANSHHWWDHIRDDFPGRTITVDYRGTGHSGAPTGGYGTATFADDVIAVLDHAGIDQADIYGTSMGGRVAQLLAAQHPHRVRRLVLGCTYPAAGTVSSAPHRYDGRWPTPTNPSPGGPCSSSCTHRPGSRPIRGPTRCSATRP